MARIPIGSGYVAFVDDSDFDWINSFRWYMTKANRSKYAYTFVGKDRVRVSMHRMILGAKSSSDFVDHIDGDGLNNTRSNLRFCTRSQNQCNLVHRKLNCKTRFKGVSKFKQINKSGVYIRYYGRIKIGNKQYVSTLVKTEEEAAREHDKLARKYHGEFAALNFPDEPGING